VGVVDGCEQEQRLGDGNSGCPDCWAIGNAKYCTACAVPLKHLGHLLVRWRLTWIDGQITIMST